MEQPVLSESQIVQRFEILRTRLSRAVSSLQLNAIQDNFEIVKIRTDLPSTLVQQFSNIREVEAFIHNIEILRANANCIV